LCSSTKYTTSRQKFRLTLWVKGCSRGLTRVLTQPWPWVDQGVSLGVVGEVFEVMAQIDRHLTKVNSVDRIIRVNKSDWKPGASQPTPLKQNLVPRFNNKIRALPSNQAKVTKVEDILAYTSR
jgi:hypothetical protein